MIEVAELALTAAIVVLAVSLVAAARAPRSWAVWSLAGAVCCLWLAVVGLARALVDSDFRLVYVVDHSRASSSGAYRLSGLWGGMEGSLLLWAALLATIVLVATISTTRSRAAHVVGVGVVLAIVVVVKVAADPFVRLEIPAIVGRGLTPILEHPAMVYHPPLLYLGLLLTVVPFLVAVDGVAGRRTDDAWRRTLRRSVLLAAAVLTAGVATGANWAYVELGWGGYWAWDPIENAALLPWLALVVAAHVLRAESGTRSVVAATTAPFTLMMLGAVLARAGVTESVHAFAEATGVGIGLVLTLAGVIAVAAIVVANVEPGVRPRRRTPLIAAGLGLAAVVVVLVGTTYPVLHDLATDDLLATTGRYYTSVIGPLAVVSLVLMGWLVRPGARRWTAAGGFAGLVVSLVAGWETAPTGLLVAAAGAAVFAGIDGLVRDRQRRVVHLAHVGFAVLMIGIAGSTASESVSVALSPGETAERGSFHVTLESLAVTSARPGVDRVEATVEVVEGGRRTVLRPALDAHRDLAVVLAETDLDASPWRDLQAVLRDADDDRALIEVRRRPLAAALWWGSALLVAAFTLAALGRPASGAGADRASLRSARARASRGAGEAAGPG